MSVMVRGRAYRSRAVARWWEFCLELGWVLGPDADPAVPDHDVWLEGPNPTLVRVLPLTDASPEAAERALGEFVDEAAWLCGFHLAVVSPGGYELPGLGEWAPGWSYAGLVAQFLGERGDLGERYARGPAVWARCAACDRVGLLHTEQSWRITPCGHYDGDTGFSQPDDEDLRLRWDLARQRTRATPRPATAVLALGQ